eukprot:Gregarina_sp_Pseudo_9__94@NODE_1062_length_1914_cov_27_850133_g994_i0_p2_GENE_NODE_1062_length_1914_cov_27_850133_g994_i0NODE_1062_length_1914_cov_27_850133_g994_i0_p2_ORF_typecomplete_len109_score12_58HRXXH/PF13933_6/5_4_NODE_1062_length_1914_cov_27_850133_g994_i015791905
MCCCMFFNERSALISICNSLSYCHSHTHTHTHTKYRLTHTSTLFHRFTHRLFAHFISDRASVIWLHSACGGGVFEFGGFSGGCLHSRGLNAQSEIPQALDLVVYGSDV